MSTRFVRPLLLVTLFLLAVAPAARAHDEAGAAPGAATIKAEFNSMLTDAEQKIIELAEATPPGKYGWSPGKDVRTTSEVFMHVAGANYMIPASVGQPAPAGVDPRTLESTIKDKDEVLNALRASFASAHAAINATNDLDTKVELFGMTMTKRYALLLLVTHAHEHLGQAIAYARSNGITPPWTQRAEAAAEARAKAKAEADKK